MGKLRDLLDEARRQRQAYEAENGRNPILGTIAEGASLLGSIPAAIEDNVREVPYGFNYGATMSPLGMVGDPAYMATEMLPMAWGRQPVDPVTYPGTTEYQAKTLFNLDPPQTFLGNLAYMAGGFASPGVNDVSNLGKMALLLSPMRARKGNLDAVAHARKMQDEGAALGDITRETYEKYGQGIEIDPVDNSVGFEISEVGPKGIKLKQNSIAALRRDKPDTLGKVIDYPELWENHPEWQNVPVRIVPGEGGSYNKRFNYIELGEREWLKNPVNTIKMILHEDQHLIDDDAGRSIGGNPYMPELAPVIKERRAELEKRFEKEVTPLIDRRMALADAYGRDRSVWPKQAADEDARIEARLQETWNRRAEEAGAIPTQAYKDLRGEQRARLTEDRYGMTIEEMIQWPRSEFETDAARKNSLVFFDSKEPSRSEPQTLILNPRYGHSVNKKIQILEDPTADEVARFAGREMGELRTLQDPKTKKIFVWNAEDGLHLDVANALLKEGKASEKAVHIAMAHKGPEKTADVIAQLRKKAEDAGKLWSREDETLKVTVPDWNNGRRPIQVLRNPSPQSLERLIQDAKTDDYEYWNPSGWNAEQQDYVGGWETRKEKVFRVLIDNETGEKYVWDATDGIHNHIFQALVDEGQISDVSRNLGSQSRHRFDSEYGTLNDLINQGVLEDPRGKRTHKTPKARDEMWSEGMMDAPPKGWSTTLDKNPIKILTNPTPEETQRLIDSIPADPYDKKKYIRGLVDRETGDKYVWASDDGFHDDVKWGLVRDKKINLSDEDVRYIEEEVARRRQLYEEDPSPYSRPEDYSDDALRYDAIGNLRRFPRHEFGTVEELTASGFIQPVQKQKAFKPRDEMWSEGRLSGNEISVDVFPFGVRGLTGYPRPMTVLKNPTPEEVLRMGRAADDGDLRVLIDKDTGDKYVWPASTAQHQDVKSGLFGGKHLTGSASNTRFIHEDGSYTDLIDRGVLPKQGHKKPKARDEMFSEGRVTEFNNSSDEFDVKFRPVWGDENAIAKTRVLKNPTVEAIKALDAKKGELRALVDRRTGDVYVWDGYEAFHDDVLNSMVDMGLVGRHDARSLITPRDVTQSAINTVAPYEIEDGNMLRFGRLSGTLDELSDRLNVKRQHKAPRRRDEEWGGKPAPVLLGSQAKGLADTPEDFPRPQFPDLEEPRQLTRASVRNEGTKFAGAPAHVTSEAAEDATVDSYLARVLAGIPAMDWYLNVSRDLLKMSGNRLGVADHLAGSLGPTSANTALAQNAQTGMRGYYQGAAGRPIKTATGLTNSRIEELFQGMVEKYGPKINPYVHHLRGEWEPPPNRAVHDVWDRRAWGYSVDKAATEAEHRWMDLATAKAVKKANDTKLGGIDNWTPEKLQAAAWAVMKAEELGIPPGELAGGYLPEFDRLTGHFRIETNPGVKNPVSSLPEAGQDAYMRAVMNNLLTPEGQLAPLQQAGGIVPPNQTAYVGAGDWEGTHSKVVSTPFIGSLLGGEYEKKPNGNVRVLREGGLVLAPEFRELADSVAATVGMLLGQKGVGYDLAREANRVMDVNAVRGITGGKQLTGDDIQKMNDYLKSKGHEGTFIVPEDSNRGFKIVFSGAEVNPGQRNLPKEETKSLLGQGQKILKEGKEAAESAGMTVDEKLWVSSGNFVGDFDNYKPSKYMKSLQKGSKIRDRLNVKVQGAKGWAARQIQVMKSTGGQWDEVWMKTLETLRDGGFDAVDEAVKKKILPAAVVGILGYNLIEKEAKRDARSQDA